MRDNIEFMSAAEFRRAGYLQEVNRRLLHPLGLALSVEITARGLVTFAGVRDARDDPAGFYFGDADAADAALARRIDSELRHRYDARMAALGYFVETPS